MHYRKASKLTQEDGDIQVSSLTSAMGKEAENIYKSFVFRDNDDKEDFDMVIEKFEQDFIPRRNVINERSHFPQKN
jgi:hypothetical protein